MGFLPCIQLTKGENLLIWWWKILIDQIAGSQRISSAYHPYLPASVALFSSSLASSSTAMDTSSLTVSLSSSAGIPSTSLDIALPELLVEEDQQLLDEYLVQESPFSNTALRGKNESMEKERARQRRIIEKHQATISAIRRGEGESSVASCHDGPRKGEVYNPGSRKPSKDCKKSHRKLQSVVRGCSETYPTEACPAFLAPFAVWGFVQTWQAVQQTTRQDTLVLEYINISVCKVICWY